jgi:hypothetical protein
VANNDGGHNQFQGFGTEAPYGDVKRQFELTREAPLSGAPIAGRAIGAPERQRSARRRAAQGGGGAAPQATTTVVPQLPIPYPHQVAMIWQRVAAIPGASDRVKQIAETAAEQVNGPAQG